MPVPSSLADLSTTASSNSPAGTDAIGTSLDDYLRTTQALLKQSVARGTDIASASSITIPTNGNYCVVTGSATINSISDSWNGRIVTLKFSGSLTITHSASLICPQGYDIETASGDCIQIVNESSGVWRCIYVLKSNVNDLFNVKDFGAIGDGVTDDTDSIQNVIDIVATLGGGTVFLPSGTYCVSSSLTIGHTQDNVFLLGEGSDRTILKKLNSMKYLTVGSSSNRITSESNTLASNASAGATSITLSTGKGANITVGTWCVLICDTTIPGHGAGVTQKTAEFVFINSKVSDTITLASPLRYAYTTSANAELQRINWVTGFSVKGIGFDGVNYTVGANVNDDNVIEINFAYEPNICEVSAWELPNYFIGLQGCLNAQLTNIRAKDQLSDGVFGAVGNYGYSVVELGLNEGLVLNGITVERARHAYTTGEYSLLYGVPTGSRISNGVAIDMRGAGFDTHPPGYGITFTNCSVMGSMGLGFQIRSVDSIVSDCQAYDCVAAAFYFPSTSRNCYLGAFKYANTNTGTWDSKNWTTYSAIYDVGTNNYIGGGSAGTFTPVLRDGPTGNAATSTSSRGYYTKNGNVVTFVIRIVGVNKSGLTGSNQIYISGLPFFSADKFANEAICGVRVNSVTLTSGSAFAHIDANVSYLSLLEGTVAGCSALLVSAINSGVSDVYVTGSYLSQ